MFLHHAPRVALAAVAVGAALTLSACVSQPTSTAVGEPHVAGENWTENVSGNPAGAGSCELVEGEGGLHPDSDCTPGAITTAISPGDASATCRESDLNPLPADVTSAVLAAYGIDAGNYNEYVVDYLVPPQLGGANDYANLWPIPIDSASRTSKARIDAAVIDAVCGGRAGIQAAQSVLSREWTDALSRLRLE